MLKCISPYSDSNIDCMLIRHVNALYILLVKVKKHCLFFRQQHTYVFQALAWFILERVVWGAFANWETIGQTSTKCQSLVSVFPIMCAFWVPYHHYWGAFEQGHKPCQLQWICSEANWSHRGYTGHHIQLWMCWTQWWWACCSWERAANDTTLDKYIVGMAFFSRFHK